MLEHYTKMYYCEFYNIRRCKVYDNNNKKRERENESIPLQASQAILEIEHYLKAEQQFKKKKENPRGIV